LIEIDNNGYHLVNTADCIIITTE